MTPKTIKMSELKVGDLFTHQLQGRGRASFTVAEVKLKQIICFETVDTQLVHDKEVKPTRRNIKGFVYLLKREEAKMT